MSIVQSPFLPKKQCNLLDRHVRIPSLKKRSGDLQQFFTFENNLIYCNDIRGLFNVFKITYEPKDGGYSQMAPFTAY